MLEYWNWLSYKSESSDSCGGTGSPFSLSLRCDAAAAHVAWLLRVRLRHYGVTELRVLPPIYGARQSKTKAEMA